MTQVYIPHENMTGTIVTEMVHGGLIEFYKGGHRRRVWMSDEDYVILNEMFFDHREIE